LKTNVHIYLCVIIIVEFFIVIFGFLLQNLRFAAFLVEVQKTPSFKGLDLVAFLIMPGLFTYYIHIVINVVKYNVR
jgi:hypothetical protein